MLDIVTVPPNVDDVGLADDIGRETIRQQDRTSSTIGALLDLRMRQR